MKRLEAPADPVTDRELQCELKWKQDGSGVELSVRCGRSLVYKRMRLRVFEDFLKALGRPDLASPGGERVAVAIPRKLLKEHDLLSYQYTVVRLVEEGGGLREVPSGRMFDTLEAARAAVNETQREDPRGNFAIRDVDYI